MQLRQYEALWTPEPGAKVRILLGAPLVNKRFLTNEEPLIFMVGVSFWCEIT